VLARVLAALELLPAPVVPATAVELVNVAQSRVGDSPGQLAAQASGQSAALDEWAAERPTAERVASLSAAAALDGLPSAQDVATACAAAVAPFAPLLLDAVEAGAQGFAERAGSSAGKAQTIWSRLLRSPRRHAEVMAAAELVASAPTQATSLAALRSAIAAQLAADPSLISDLTSILGGARRVQAISLSERSEATDITQTSTLRGDQHIHVSGASRASRISQRQL